MSDIPAIEHDPLPSPRDKERLTWLSLAIGAPPVFWTIQLLLLSAVANYTCFPGDYPLGTAPDTMSWVPALEYIMDVIAIVVAVGSGWISLHYYRLAQERTRSHSDAFSVWKLDRLCFMAMGGILSGGGFLVAVVFETIASIMVSPCAG